MIRWIFWIHNYTIAFLLVYVVGYENENPLMVFINHKLLINYAYLHRTKVHFQDLHVYYNISFVTCVPVNFHFLFIWFFLIYFIGLLIIIIMIHCSYLWVLNKSHSSNDVWSGYSNQLAQKWRKAGMTSTISI